MSVHSKVMSVHSRVMSVHSRVMSVHSRVMPQQGYATAGLCHSRVMRLVVWSCRLVYVCMYIYIHVDKIRLFSALLLEKLLLSVVCSLLFGFKRLQCGLLHPASYTDRAIHAFPNKMRKPPCPEIFSSDLKTAHHTL